MTPCVWDALEMTYLQSRRMVEVEMWTRKLFSKYKVLNLQEENHGMIWTEGKGGHKEKTETKESKKDVKKEKI